MIIIRKAEPNDANQIAKVHVSSWQTSYRGIIPDDYLKNISYNRRAEYWAEEISCLESSKAIYVAEEAGNIIGFVSGGPDRNSHPNYDGELYAIYLLESSQRRGIGRKLTIQITQAIQARNFRSMIVWVLEDNLPARGFYEKMGGVFVENKSFQMGELSLIEVAYGWLNFKSILGFSPNQ